MGIDIVPSREATRPSTNVGTGGRLARDRVSQDSKKRLSILLGTTARRSTQRIETSSSSRKRRRDRDVQQAPITHRNSPTTTEGPSRRTRTGRPRTGRPRTK
jgi:hypothetical protein